MAKKIEKAESGISLVDLLGKIDNGVEILADSKSAVIKDYISTGNYILNAAMTGSLFKGVPAGRVLTLAGEPGTGKTFLALSICREAQKKGYTPIYLDSEGSIDIDFVARIGCDPDNFLIKQVGLVSEISTFVANLCANEKSLPANQRHKIILVIDSLGNLTSDKELQTTLDGGGAKDMTRNQQIKAFFRTNMTPIAQLGIPMIVNTHIYQTQDVFSKQVVSGGCVVPGTKIETKDGLKVIEDINVGDMVLSHDGEYHEVVKTFEFEKTTYTFTFEDGKTIECSFDHKFLVADGDDTKWVCAKDLSVNDEILTNDSKLLKIVQKVESSSPKKVHDICVDETHSYVSEGGIINHNSGINYNSSLTVMLSVAKLDDKESDKAAEKKVGEFTKTGVLVTATPKKSRFTIPQKVRFQIPFFKSPNPYTGLEAYVTWENSGIIRGKMIDEKEYSKLSEADKAQCYPMTDENGNPAYALRKDTSRNIVVEHLHGERPFPSLWTSEVFTDEVLHKLDETVIRPNFELPSQETNADVDELAALENIQ